MEGLTVPHPSLHERRFVLVPMNEIAPGWKHPVLGTTMKELLAHCTDVKKVWIHGTSGVDHS
jgi:2-amino-4-hydroxy-6-hydroxymethyldihydropteridine diphosphokinase